MIKDPTLSPILEDGDQPATKGDVHNAITLLESRIDAKLDIVKREILHHFDAAVENIEDELKGANRDEVDLIRDKQLDQERRLSEVEHRIGV